MPVPTPKSPCPGCGRPKSKPASLCWDCSQQQVRPQVVRLRGGANAARERVTVENLVVRLPRAKVHECPSSQSPNQRHHYILDMDSRGMCQYCGEPGYFPSTYKWSDVL